MTVRAQVQALSALGRLDDARASGEDTLDRLGEHLPYARSIVLATLADALHDAGQIEEAYEVLHRSVAAEREGLQDLARQLAGIGADFSFAVLDLDHLKGINDTSGHEIGDQVLVRVAGLLLDVVRRSDVVARTGGEEFVLLMPAADDEAAERCCERALAAIREFEWEGVAPGLRVTASAGIARSGEALGLDRVASLADRRLYDAKALGRDRVVT